MFNCTIFNWVFWLNIVENWVYVWYRYCSKLFEKLRKESEFCNTVAEILTKSIREERQVMWWEDLNFDNLITEILAARICCPAARWSARRGVAKRKPIVATKLPKMGGKKKRENCGNQIAEKLGRNLIVILGNKVAENEGTNLIVI